MNNFPPLHPHWLVTFWFHTPGLQMLNPHIVLSLIAILAVGLFFLKRKKAPAKAPAADREEEQFQHLLMKKQIIEGKMKELEELWERGELGKDQFHSKHDEYKKHLERVKKELLYFT